MSIKDGYNWHLYRSPVCLVWVFEILSRLCYGFVGLSPLCNAWWHIGQRGFLNVQYAPYMSPGSKKNTSNRMSKTQLNLWPFTYCLQFGQYLLAILLTSFTSLYSISKSAWLTTYLVVINVQNVPTILIANNFFIHFPFVTTIIITFITFITLLYWYILSDIY